jgi:Zn-dependent M32 family carboxypeptidase
MKKTKRKEGQLDEGTKQWLEKRPELVERLKEIRRICENERREHELLAQVEAGLVEQLDAAGRELVGAWLEKREEQEHQKARTHGRMRRHSKKNCEC